jgi:hypothetical protein
MEILYFFPEYKSNMGQWQKSHIINELQNHGHNIHLFNPLLFPTFEKANNELVNYIKNKKINFDLLINSLGSDKLFPDTVTTIKQMGIRTLLICFDNLHAPFMHKAVAPYFDLVWLTSKETREMFKRWGCNIVFMPYAANPKMFFPRYNIEIPKVGFIGIPYGSRITKINKLINNQINCQIYSQSLSKNNKFEIESSKYFHLLKSAINLIRFNIGRKVIFGAIKSKYFYHNNRSLSKSQYLELYPSVSFEEMNYLYSNFAISLGITELRNTNALKRPIHKLHLRTFEIPMCGGLQCTSYTEELAEYFEDGKEIILYKSEEEFISKVRFYLKPENKTLRDNMKIMARKRAENEHTWINRFNIVFKLLSS